MLRKSIALLVVFSCAPPSIAAAQSGGTIVQDSNISLLSSGFGTQDLRIFRDANDQGDNTGLIFDLVPQTLPITAPPSLTLDGPVSMFLDATGGDWFIAQPGQVFSPGTIAAGQFTDIAFAVPYNVPLGQMFQNTGVPLHGTFTGFTTQFYVAVATRSRNNVPSPLPLGIVTPSQLPRDILGWALIEATLNIDTGVSNVDLLDSAIGFGTGNIIVGQNAFAVPEPSSGIVFATLVGLGVARRRKR